MLPNRVFRLLDHLLEIHIHIHSYLIIVLLSFFFILLYIQHLLSPLFSLDS